ncbi:MULTISPECIES: tRNA pseudouridine(55) synthase TruB [unclassified Parvimonas]|uniref:tRNA pseudouridine(55) synthase TruB n=1 Tax=unclassified Parvimonas TaxID=1151464 RepID=UPI002B46C61E|nr:MULTISPECIES: tRNA pseudouridine(55) synthase TruB [unclassified Parvimonas]MEB3024631.1 tRNA pseudouridine(55) synthase TruB [Parvimonas sp. M13]MEB3072177.1 tRNA pseudouridine(55) synthase TruB [Parvimonas sp. C2]MEB3088776.1 tRNA pseudouridine(55) synthase TruB [Parvimonas sp. M20]
MNFNGILNVYKPKGFTSRDVVNIVRKLYKTKKVGHAGTLDPNATGVLPIAIGNATKIVDYIQSMGKCYVGEMTLGIETDTLDIWGQSLNSKEICLDKNQFFEVVKKYDSKKIWQIPPMYSALKKDGKRLYEYARLGIEVEREKREVEIDSLIILNFYDNKIRFEVNCSKGTYIRTLFNDIALDTDNFAYMSSLCRSKYGIFTIKNALSLERLKKFDEMQLKNSLINVEDVFEYGSINFDKKYFKHISNGLRKTFNIEQEGIFKIYCDDIFIGIGELIPQENGKLLKMRNIFYKVDDI